MFSVLIRVRLSGMSTGRPGHVDERPPRPDRGVQCGELVVARRITVPEHWRKTRVFLRPVSVSRKMTPWASSPRGSGGRPPRVVTTRPRRRIYGSVDLDVVHRFDGVRFDGLDPPGSPANRCGASEWSCHAHHSTSGSSGAAQTGRCAWDYDTGRFEVARNPKAPGTGRVPGRADTAA